MSDMAWAIFTHESNWQRPRSAYSFNAHPSPLPQERPRDFIEYCVSRGWAEEVASPTKAQAEAIRPKRARK